MSRYYDLPQPSYVPDESFIFFGPDPVHTPAREGQDFRSLPPPIGQRSPRAAQDRATCSECGGLKLDENGYPLPALGGSDPVGVYSVHVSDHAGSRRKSHRGAGRAQPMVCVCGGCMRSSYDGSPALDKAVKSALSGDPDGKAGTKAKFRPRGKPAE